LPAGVERGGWRESHGAVVVVSAVAKPSLAARRVRMRASVSAAWLITSIASGVSTALPCIATN
jgi:hypothetical protein